MKMNFEQFWEYKYRLFELLSHPERIISPGFWLSAALNAKLDLTFVRLRVDMFDALSNGVSAKPSAIFFFNSAFSFCCITMN